MSNCITHLVSRTERDLGVLLYKFGITFFNIVTSLPNNFKISHNRILHQLKGFTPVFCVDSLVELVVKVEEMSKHAEIGDVRTTYNVLAPQLEALRQEVIAHLDQHSAA